MTVVVGAAHTLRTSQVSDEDEVLLALQAEGRKLLGVRVVVAGLDLGVVDQAVVGVDDGADERVFCGQERLHSCPWMSILSMTWRSGENFSRYFSARLKAQRFSPWTTMPDAETFFSVSATITRDLRWYLRILPFDCAMYTCWQSDEIFASNTFTR
jgi:hypothetical protein